MLRVVAWLTQEHDPWLDAALAGLGLAVACGLLACVAVAVRRVRARRDVRLGPARHDALTGLLDRAAFVASADAELARLHASGRQAAILCIDLDALNHVNDLYGHAAGDMVLGELAARLNRIAAGECVAARLGGDEFALLAPCGDADEAIRLAKRVRNALSAPVRLDGTDRSVTVSVGVAAFPRDATALTSLLARADTALARAKRGGPGGVRFFDAAIDSVVRDRRVLARDLRAAISAEHLQLTYQPQLDLRTDRITGFEVLVRWIHPERGEVSPAIFIPIAEETFAILDLGYWVLRTACREAAGWQNPLDIAVNLSLAQLRQPGLAERVAGILRETGLPASRLELEITESFFLDNAPSTLAILADIKTLGIRIAVDDFGTGYSSLATLQAFDFDTIKIDRSFVMLAREDRKSEAIIRSLLLLGDSLSIEVVAEGVETADQLDFMREHRCGTVQGYLCGRPLPIESYRDLLSQPALPRETAEIVPLRQAG